MRFSFLRLLLDPDADNGSGNGNPAAGGSKQGDDKGGTGGGNADAGKGYEAALAKHGNDAAAMARTIYADNEKLRADNEQLRGKLPADGSLVLNKADAARWSELGKLGTPEEIKAKLADGDAAIGKVAAFERKELTASAAAAHGYDADVLGGLPGFADLAIEVKDETKGGKAVRTAEVVATAKDDKGADVETRTPLDKYAERTWPKFMPALKSGAATSAPPRVGGSPGRAVPPQAQAQPKANADSTAAPPARRRLSL